MKIIGDGFLELAPARRKKLTNNEYLDKLSTKNAAINQMLGVKRLIITI